MRNFPFVCRGMGKQALGKKDVLGFAEDRRGMVIFTDVNFHIPMFRKA